MTAMGFTRVAPLPVTSVIAVHDADQNPGRLRSPAPQSSVPLSLPQKAPPQRLRADMGAICDRLLRQGSLLRRYYSTSAGRADVALEGVLISAGERDRPPVELSAMVESAGALWRWTWR